MTNTNNKTKKVVIEKFGNTFSIYEESGVCVEPDFKSYRLAKTWAEENNYEVVNNFFI